RYIMLVRQVCFVLLGLIAAVLPLSAEISHAGYGNLPLVFEPNQGQTDSSVRFLSRGNGYALFLKDSEAVLSIVRPSHAVVTMHLTGQNHTPKIDGLEPQPGVSNYFRGNDSTQWRQAVPHFSKVQYRDVYPGIDLQYYG